MMSRLREILRRIAETARSLPLRELGQAALDFLRRVLPEPLKPHALPVALGGAAFCILLLMLVLLLVAGSSKPQRLPSKGPLMTSATPLKNYHLYFETNIADPGVREHILKPEEMPVRQDRNYLEENLRKGRLFDQSELQIQMELNRLTRK